MNKQELPTIRAIDPPPLPKLVTFDTPYGITLAEVIWESAPLEIVIVYESDALCVTIASLKDYINRATSYILDSYVLASTIYSAIEEAIRPGSLSVKVNTKLAEGGGIYITADLG